MQNIKYNLYFLCPLRETNSVVISTRPTNAVLKSVKENHYWQPPIIWNKCALALKLIRKQNNVRCCGCFVPICVVLSWLTYVNLLHFSELRSFFTYLLIAQEPYLPIERGFLQCLFLTRWHNLMLKEDWKRTINQVVNLDNTSPVACSFPNITSLSITFFTNCCKHLIYWRGSGAKKNGDRAEEAHRHSTASFALSPFSFQLFLSSIFKDINSPTSNVLVSI